MINKFIFTNKLGIARSLIALSMLFTLSFNSIKDNIPIDYFNYTLKNNFSQLSINFFSYFKYEYIYIPYFFSIIVLLFVISGIYPRVTSFFHAWTSYSIFKSIVILEGGDQIAMILSILLVPVLIFDNRKNHWNETFEINSRQKLIIVYSFLMLIRFQMSFLYFDAAFEKFKVDEWVDGTAIYYWINHNVFGAPYWLNRIFNILFSVKYVLAFITFCTLLLELFLAFGLLAKDKTKNQLFKYGLFLHFSIFVLLGLPTFMLAMFGGLVLYLINLQTTFNFRLWKK